MAKKDAPKKTAQKGAAAGSDKKRSQTVPSRSPAMKGLVVQAEGIYGEIKGGRRPSMRIPIRSLTNVSFSPRKGFFTIGDKVSKRTLSYQTVKPFAWMAAPVAGFLLTRHWRGALRWGTRGWGLWRMVRPLLRR